MLILAGISLSGLIGGKGLFQRTEDASSKYNEAKAREVLETVLLTDGQFEKNTNPKYNQDDFLDELIKKEIPGSDIRGDVAIIGDYAYDLDRSVPKIGIRGNNGYLGNPKDLVWPDVEATVQLASDKKNATITIKAKEEKNGINKIEVWLLGEIVKEYKYTDGAKTPRTETYTANRNGIYTIKAYANLMESTRTTVIGIIPSVEFSPNGSKEWKKEHSTQITVKETGEKVKSLKYKWTNSVNPPGEGDFSSAESCNNNDTITGKGFTGKYYLWILTETESKENCICGSNEFYFDNQGPIITSFTTEKYSEEGITLNVKTKDEGCGIGEIKFYVDDVLKDTQNIPETNEEVTKSITVTGLTMGEHKCKVEVYDLSNLITSREINGMTKSHTWEYYGIKNVHNYTLGEWTKNSSNKIGGNNEEYVEKVNESIKVTEKRFD